jgi:DNA polymerase III epsilon subunit-like protein
MCASPLPPAPGHDELLVSVDVETSGPNPGAYSLLSIGACLVADPAQGFYAELQPVGANALPSALAVSGLSLDELARTGLAPAEAMRRFDAWLRHVAPPGAEPVFVGFNAPFDWMFVCDYFHRYLGHNPFGHAALDIRSYYMGLSGAGWQAGRLHNLMGRYMGGHTLSHNALHDARDQATLFRAMLAEAAARREETHEH